MAGDNNDPDEDHWQGDNPSYEESWDAGDVDPNFHNGYDEAEGDDGRDGDESGDNESTSDGAREQEQHDGSTTPVGSPRAVLDPVQRIRQARTKLLDVIGPDQEMSWENEKNWRQDKKYAGYRAEVEQLLKDESISLVATQSDPSPTNFLQHVLDNTSSFVPTVLRLYKLKFMLQLVVDLDPSQLSPKYGKKPLHQAAEFDIELKKDNVTSDLTRYTCELMGDEAAEDIARPNPYGETVLHLAIRHDLEGVEYLIDRAQKRAFSQQRSSKDVDRKQQHDDGNTPLHDALDFKKFIVDGPICRLPPGQPPAGRPSTSRNVSMSSLQARRPPLQTRDTSEDAQNQQTANQTGPRNSAAISPSSPQPRVAPSAPCQTCKEAGKKLTEERKYRKKIISMLLDRDKGVLMRHNSAGQSPYLYHLATRNKYVDENKSPNDPATPRHAKGDDGSKPSRLGIPGGEPSQRKTDLHRANQGEKRDWQKPTDKKEATGGEKPKDSMVDKGASQKSAIEGQKPGDFEEGSQRNREAVKRGMKNKPTKHAREDLKPWYLISNEVSQLLKESAFALGGYKEAYKCLFRDQSAKVPRPPDEVGRQRKFFLAKNQRVSHYTTKNFDFLLFEKMLSSVVLSLEYTEAEVERFANTSEAAARWEQNQAHLKDVFTWLKKKKGVKSIIKLVVKDNPRLYCSDATVEECLRDLEVRYLHWNRPDLCAETLRNVPDLVEVSLYSSGINAVLWSWSDEQGLGNLKKLRTVHLHPQRGRESDARNRQNVEKFEERLEEWHEKHASQTPKIIVHYDDKQSKGDGGATNSDLGKSGTTKHSWFQAASTFSDAIYNAFGDDVRHNPNYQIKVCLIDDGVDPTYDHNGECLHHTGWPSEDSGEGEQSFYVSTNQHGSKMAWLIRKVCPFVTIYVAKLDTQQENTLRHRSFNLKQATEAVEWATEQRVDIISMSWNARRIPGDNGNHNEIEKLERAIGKAAERKILMYCAACDAKSDSTPNDKWVPCDCDKVTSIGATDMNNNPKQYVVVNNKVHYLFPGEHLLKDGEPDEVGNSGATALASGLAALVLFCMRKENERTGPDVQAFMDKVMRKVFNSESSDKVVHVKDVLQLGHGGSLKSLVNKFTIHRA